MSKGLYLLSFLILIGCGSEQKPELTFTEKGREVPAFNVDSAYYFVIRKLSIILNRN